MFFAFSTFTLDKMSSLSCEKTFVFYLEGVRKVCGGKLLQKWLYSFEGNVLELLHSLDVENSTDICQQVLKQFFTDTPIADLVANFTLLDDQ